MSLTIFITREGGVGSILKLVKFKVGEAGNVSGGVNGGSTVMVLAMLSCGSLVWIDTGSGVAAVSPSLRFSGVSPLIFLFVLSLLEEWL